MKVQEFIDNINSKDANLSLDQKINKVLIVKKYIPIDEKKDIIKKIIGESMLYNNGIYFDEVELYLNFSMNVIYSCTNLEKEDIHSDYDLLCSNYLFDVVMNRIEGEYSCFKILLEMERDTLQNQDALENSLTAKIEDFLENLFSSILNIIKTLNIEGNKK